MWYWPEEERLVYILKRGDSGPIQLDRYSESAWIDLRRSHITSHNGYKFKNLQIGINLVNRWLENEGELDEDHE
jgi:hypothetical protein